MGQFLQGGNFGHFVSYFFKRTSLSATKPNEIDLIFQLIWDNCVFKTLETLLFGLRKKCGVPCSTPILVLLSHFWVKIRALLRPNLQDCI